jgi:hypothetical protein
MANNRNKAIRGEDVELSIQYYGPDGLEMDAESTPEIKITDPDGNVVVAATSTGVSRSDTGLYVYTLSVGSSVDKGLWTDVWTSTVDGTSLQNEFKFLVTDDSSAVAGTVTLGDSVDFGFSEDELNGVNILLIYLKARLRSHGKKPIRDEYGAFVLDGYGEITYEECDVFTDDILVCFLCQALSEFNMVPFFTSYQFSDSPICTLFSSAIVTQAPLYRLPQQLLMKTVYILESQKTDMM